MFDMQIDDSGGKGILKLDGDVTIEQAAELKNVLIDAIDKVNDLDIDVGELKNIDLSGLQLLCSAHRSSLNKNKTLNVINKKNDSYVKTILDAGFNRNLVCDVDKNNSCLWIIGE